MEKEADGLLTIQPPAAAKAQGGLDDEVVADVERKVMLDLKVRHKNSCRGASALVKEQMLALLEANPNATGKAIAIRLGGAERV